MYYACHGKIRLRPPFFVFEGVASGVQLVLAALGLPAQATQRGASVDQGMT
jgi:hypothetical protein